MKTRTTRVLLASVFSLALGALPAQAQSWGQFGVDILPMPVGYSVDRFGAVNDAGQVATYRFNGSLYESFLWDSNTGSASSVGTLGSSTFALAVNNSGSVVGYSYNGSGVEEGFVYDGSSIQGIGTLGQPRSFATGINDAGQVVGYSTNNAQTAGEAFVYDAANGLQGLGAVTSPSPISAALGINEAGEIAGSLLGPSFTVDAFVYDGTTLTNFGGLGGPRTEAYDINESGKVVGVGVTGSGLAEGFVFDGTTIQGLGTMGGNRSNAYAISDADQIVGWAAGGSLPSTRAVLWEGGTGYFLDALVGSGWSFVEALGISGGGTVVALGRNADYEGGALTNIVLRQRSAPVSVPEPAQGLLLVTVLAAGLVALRLRRQPS